MNGEYGDDTRIAHANLAYILLVPLYAHDHRIAMAAAQVAVFDEKLLEAVAMLAGDYRPSLICRVDVFHIPFHSIRHLDPDRFLYEIRRQIR